MIQSWDDVRERLMQNPLTYQLLQTKMPPAEVSRAAIELSYVLEKVIGRVPIVVVWTGWMFALRFEGQQYITVNSNCVASRFTFDGGGRSIPLPLPLLKLGEM